MPDGHRHPGSARPLDGCSTKRVCARLYPEQLRCVEGPVYEVCETCAHLRVYARGQLDSRPPPSKCPACGGVLAVHDGDARFPPTYVARAALELHAEPPL